MSRINNVLTVLLIGLNIYELNLALTYIQKAKPFMLIA